MNLALKHLGTKHRFHPVCSREQNRRFRGSWRAVSMHMEAVGSHRGSNIMNDVRVRACRRNRTANLMLSCEGPDRAKVSGHPVPCFLPPTGWRKSGELGFFQCLFGSIMLCCSSSHCAYCVARPLWRVVSLWCSVSLSLGRFALPGVPPSVSVRASVSPLQFLLQS